MNSNCSLQEPVAPDAVYMQDTQVAARYNVSRATIWRWTKIDPNFPKPINLSPGCARWLIDGLKAWEHAKAARIVT